MMGDAVDLAVTPSIGLEPTIRSTSDAAVAKASALAARRSIWRVQRSATTLGRVPPPMTPALTVTVGQRPLRSWREITWWAATRMADRPFSGSTPACAARPVTVTS